MRYNHPLVVYAIKYLLGEEFIMVYDRYQINTDISSMFLSLALDRGLSKKMARNLCKVIFKVYLLGGLEDILRNCVDFWILVPKDFDKQWEEVLKLLITLLDDEMEY